MEEIWKDITGYEGLYQVSNFGRVRSMYYGRAKMLKLCPAKDGYLRVCLAKNKTNTTRTVHRLVAETFIPNPNNYPQVNHKNEIKTDNSVGNLEWCSGKYNINFGTGILKRAKQRQKKVMQYDLNGKHIATFDSLKEAAFSIKQNCGTHISAVCLGKRKQTGGYVWKFAS